MDFPDNSTGIFISRLEVEQLQSPRPLTGSTITVALTVVTTGTPTFVFFPDNVCPVPSTTRPFIDGAGGRWWSNPASYILAAGSDTISVAVSSALWSDATGQFGNQDPTTLAAFNATMANPSIIGLSFGGGCFFGHGVNVTGGTAQFQLTGYTYQ